MCIKIHFYLFLLAIYFYAIHKLQTFLLFYAFAIIHEVAHISVALLLKVKIREIILLPVGVCAKYDYIENRIKEILIAAAGPLFSIIIGILTKNSLEKEINFAIAILNLIPIYPLDGGRIIRGLFEVLLGYKKSIIYSNFIAKSLLMLLIFLGIILAVYFKNFSLIILDVYILSTIREELKKERIQKVINELISKE